MEIDERIPFEKIKNKHLMAIDYGQKFTGVATYYQGRDPFPLCYGRIAYKSDEQLINEISKIIDDEFIDILVVGIPFFTDGKASKMTQTVMDFFTKAKTSLKINTYSIDETLTTFEAEERMKNDPKYNFQVDLKKIDELSALIILEQFLKNSSD